jgi:RNA polymerase sigma factor (sigma-70 family)
MLPDKLILPICHKWARILWQKGSDFDELVSVAYCYLKPRPEDSRKEVLHIWAKFVIIHFLKHRLGMTRLHTSSKKENEAIKNIYRDYCLMAASHHNNTTISQDEILDIKEALTTLSEDEASLIYMYFWLGKSYREIGEEFGRSKFWVHENLKRVIGLVRNEVLK